LDRSASRAERRALAERRAIDEAQSQPAEDWRRGRLIEVQAQLEAVKDPLLHSDFEDEPAGEAVFRHTRDEP
jgi:hypothetical protein